MTAKEGCSNWKAWHDSEPGGEPTLHVIGECHFEDSGYSVELKPQEPQGINPTIYILQKVVHKPSHVSHHQQNIPVRYQEKTRAKYVEVHILPDDVHIPVKEVWVGAGTEMVTGSAQVQVPVFLSGIVCTTCV